MYSLGRTSRRVRAIQVTAILTAFTVVIAACSGGTTAASSESAGTTAASSESGGTTAASSASTERSNSSTAGSGAPALPTKTLKIGLLAPLTGSSAADGLLMKQGAQLAVNEINSSGGVAGYKFSLDIQDVQDQNTAVVASSVRSLIADSDVKAVVTGYADGSNFEINQLAQANMPYLISANSAQTEAIISKDPAKYPTVWSMSPSFAAYGTGLPKFISSLIGQGQFPNRNKKVYVITSENPYSQGISKGVISTFKTMGWTIAGNESIPFGTVNDWTPILSHIQQADPEVIINTAYLTNNDATFMQGFYQNPTKSLVFIQYGPSVPQFLSLAGKTANGVIYDSLGGIIRSAKNQTATKLIAKFKAAYNGADPGSYGLWLYDEVMLYASALQKVKNPDDKLAIGKAIGATHLTNQDYGNLSFDPKTHLAIQGDDGVPLQIYQIQNQQRILLNPAKYQTGKFLAPPWMK